MTVRPRRSIVSVQPPDALARVADFDESAVGDADFRHDGPLRVHRVNPPVGQEQQASAGTRRRLSTAGHAADGQRGGNPRRQESGSEG